MQDLNESIEFLRIAMINSDEKSLKLITSNDLSYGHSNGLIENQTEFVELITSGKSQFKTLEFKDNKITYLNETIATVRNIFIADTVENFKPNTAYIGVLQVWRKDSDGWKLCTRQAYKLVKPE